MPLVPAWGSRTGSTCSGSTDAVAFTGRVTGAPPESPRTRRSRVVSTIRRPVCSESVFSFGPTWSHVWLAAAKPSTSV